MTEREAVEKLKNMRLFMQIEDENNDCKFTEDDYKANEMAIQALEKQIAKGAITNHMNIICPVCNVIAFSDELPFLLFKSGFCWNCGQKLDWSD